jgi:hypothetical protein
VPARQGRQTDALDFATASEKRPAAQSMQLAEKVDSPVRPLWYLPAGQLKGQLVVPLLGCQVPTPQLTQLVAPVKLWYLPGAHSAHVEELAAPTAAENVPAMQLVHQLVPSVARQVPAPQLAQLVAPLEATNRPAAQATQLVAPVFGWYRPSGQSAHLTSRTSNAVLPEGQSTQLVSPDAGW